MQVMAQLWIVETSLKRKREKEREGKEQEKRNNKQYWPE